MRLVATCSPSAAIWAVKTPRINALEIEMFCVRRSTAWAIFAVKVSPRIECRARVGRPRCCTAILLPSLHLRIETHGERHKIGENHPGTLLMLCWKQTFVCRNDGFPISR